MSNPWLRLWTDMPTDPKWRTIARLSGQPVASVISVYIFVLINASNANERGRTQNLISEDIASALDVETNDIDAILAQMEGRVIKDGIVTGWDKRQPIREDGAAERARLWRERNRTQTNALFAPEESRGDTDIEQINTSALTANAVPADKLLGTLPLNDGTDWEIYLSEVELLQPLYPAVDVRQELRNMKGWLIGNPTNRKTKRGIKRFISSWLSNAQDKAKPNGGNKTNGKSADRAYATATALIQEIEDSHGAHAGELLPGSGAD